MKHTFDFSKISFNAGLLVKEMQKRDIEISFIGKTDLYEAKLNNHSEIFYDIHSRIVPFPYGWIISDKFYTKQYLKNHNFPVVDGFYFNFSDIRQSIEYAKKLGFPVVLKPLTGSHGEYVYVGITSKEELEVKIQVLIDEKVGNGYFLIEKEVKGNEFRLFYTKNNFFAAVERIPANVVGDGKNSIIGLIKKENYKRTHPRINCLCEIWLDDIVFDYLEKQKLFITDIPKKGKKIFLRQSSNVSAGGNCHDVTEKVHSSVKNLAKNILKTFKDLPFIGIDLICENIEKPLKKGNHIICELNPAPGLSLHMLPEKGTKRNVAGALVDLIFPETKYD